MSLTTPLNIALKCYDSTMRNDYNNSIIKTMIMASVYRLVSKLDSIPGVSYESILDNNDDYGLQVCLKNNLFSFKIFAKVHQVIHKNYNESFISHLDNSCQNKLSQEHTYVESLSSASHISFTDPDIILEPLDATWKLYYNDKKFNNEQQHTPITKGFKASIFNKITTVTKSGHDYYAKNTMNMLDYIHTILKSIVKVTNDIKTRHSTCDWSLMTFENFISASIMLHLKDYFERKGRIVIISCDQKYDLIIDEEIHLSYDMQDNKINVKRLLSEGRMLIALKDICIFIFTYFERKQILGDGFKFPKKK